MFKYRFLSFFMVLFVLAIFSNLACNSNSKSRDKQPEINQKVLKESLEKVNRKLVLEEATAIDSYAKRHNLRTTKTGSGLQFAVIAQGKGDSIKTGEIVRFEYVTKLLSGDIIYSSEKSGLKQFVVGRGGVEAGLEEAVLHLKHGDSAIIILPSHLAFGLLGDQNLIPPRSTVIYEIEILEMQ